MGLYQLGYLDRIPQSAAVNESVNLVKLAQTASAAGLVNAVLRKAARHPNEKSGQGKEDALERASFELSHPRWMIERWQSALGEQETSALALANNNPAGIAFRVNTIHTTVDEVLTHLKAEGVTASESKICPGAFTVESGSAAAVNWAATRGLVYIQDEASQLVSVLLGPRAGQRILDLCAAPGSKTSHIAALAGDEAWIIASDIHPHRVNALNAVCQRLGLTSIDGIVLDATHDLPFNGEAQLFDRVLVDAPCSGTGTLRSNPEIKWRLTPDDISRLAALQFCLLERAAAAVASGGRLVYSTCSIEREENEDVIHRFLEGNSLFKTIPPNASANLVNDEGFVHTYPHRHGCDGFFAAVLERVR
jgi:16S rRNA (cytosine967-C5)-methyltransferase